jgi:hypothetical protein
MLNIHITWLAVLCHCQTNLPAVMQTENILSAELKGPLSSIFFRHQKSPIMTIKTMSL